MALRFVTVTDNTIAYESEELFRNVAGIEDDEIQRQHTPTGSSRREDLKRKGARIRELCDEFERSPQGQEIKKIVDEIKLEEITEEDLEDIADEIFGGGGSDGGGKSGGGWWSGIVGFFTFCKNLFSRGFNAVLGVCKTVCKTIYRCITNIVSKVFNWIKRLFEW